jgi:hypothetical protein
MISKVLLQRLVVVDADGSGLASVDMGVETADADFTGLISVLIRRMLLN